MRPPKYRNRKTCCGIGHVHDSAKEARRCDELALLERVGRIERLEVQPRYPIIVNGVQIAVYVGDFHYFEDAKSVVEDVKGVKTPVYNLKKKLVRAIYGVEVRET